jgi:hypothetical protein
MLGQSSKLIAFNLHALAVLEATDLNPVNQGYRNRLIVYPDTNPYHHPDEGCEKKFTVN